MSEHQRILSILIKEIGPIPAVRVSCAQASGAAKKYSYWGATRYEIRNRKRDGIPIAVAVERASSDRRSIFRANQDAEEIAGKEGRFFCDKGELNESDCEDAIHFLVNKHLKSYKIYEKL